MTETITPTADRIAHVQNIATALETETNHLSDWLQDEVLPLWSDFLAQALSKAGLTHSRTYRGANSRVSGYYVSLTSEGALFTGWASYMGESEEEEVTIPWGFVNPATRTATEILIERALTAERAEDDAAAVKQVAHQAAQKRAADEKELAALAARLGKKVVDGS